jgi:hypothetical protein
MFGLFWRRFVFLTWRQYSRFLANNGNQRAKPYSYPHLAQVWFGPSCLEQVCLTHLAPSGASMFGTHLAQVCFGVPHLAKKWVVRHEPKQAEKEFTFSSLLKEPPLC